MILDFNEIPLSVLPAFKGGEGALNAHMFANELGKIMVGCLEPGSNIGMHTHEGNSEMIFFLEGDAHVLYDGGEEYLTAGQCHYCPMGHTHSLRNDSDKPLRFFAVVPEHKA